MRFKTNPPPLLQRIQQATQSPSFLDQFDELYRLAVRHQDTDSLQLLVIELIERRAISGASPEIREDRRQFARTELYGWLKSDSTSWQQLSEIRKPEHYINRAIRNALHRFDNLSQQSFEDSAHIIEDNRYVSNGQQFKQPRETDRAAYFRQSFGERQESLNSLQGKDSIAYISNRLPQKYRDFFKLLTQMRAEYDLDFDVIDQRIAAQLNLTVRKTTEMRNELFKLVKKLGENE